MNTKLTFLSILTLVAALTLAVPAHAQVSTNAVPDTSSFLQSVEQYFTSLDTNAADAAQFDSVRGAVWTGAEYQNGVNIDSVFCIEYQPFTNLNLSIGSLTRNAAIAGAIDAEQIDLGYDFNRANVQLTGGLGLGYDFNRRAAVTGLYLEAKKSLTPHTFAGLRLEEDISFTGKQPAIPIIGIFAGFTF